jgi:uncharacterized membrane protein YkvA (DUF1232 family)
MLKKEILILYYGLRDRRTGIWNKLPVLFSFVYLLSPIDLVPDFIPFLGYLDDLIVVPLLLNWSVRLLPREVYDESLVKASRKMKKFQFFFIALIILCIALLLLIFFLLRHLIISK